MSGKIKKQDVLALCLEEIRSGRVSPEDCLKNYPELEKELRPLIEVASAIRPPEVHASDDFKARTRQLLYREMNSTEKQRSGDRSGSRTFFMPAFRWATMVTVIVLVVSLFGGSIYASQASLPGDPLYKVKTGVENVQLATTFNLSKKADLYLVLSQKRVDEIVDQSRLNLPINEVALTAVTENIDQAIKTINKDQHNDDKVFLKSLSSVASEEEKKLSMLLPQSSQDVQSTLNQTIQAAKRVNVIVRVAGNNSLFLAHNPSVMDSSIENGMFKISGSLKELDGNKWQVGNVTIDNIRPIPDTKLEEGSVEIEGLSHDNEFYVSKMLAISIPANQVKIQGTFMGTNAEGSEWNISEIPVTIPKSVEKPEIGVGLSLDQIGANKGQSVDWQEDKEWYFNESEESDEVPHASKGGPASGKVNNGAETAASDNDETKSKTDESRSGTGAFKLIRDESKPDASGTKPITEESKSGTGGIRPTTDESKSSTTVTKSDTNIVKPGLSQDTAKSNSEVNKGNSAKISESRINVEKDGKKTRSQAND
jgi:hypothetical protein